MSTAPRGALARLRALCGSGVTSAANAPLRSVVTIACVVAALAPYLAGLGVARGLADDAEAALRDGADLVVSARRLGRSAPVPLAGVDEIAAIPGVERVVPRLVAPVRIGKDSDAAVLIGVAPEAYPTTDGGALAAIDGRAPSDDAWNELVVGAALARRLHLSPGSMIPPFYRSEKGERVSKVVGVLPADAPLWASNVLVTTFRSASEMLDASGHATDLLVTVRPGYAESVQRALLVAPPRDTPDGPLRLTAVTRDELAAYLPEGPAAREGVLTVHFLLAFALGIPLVLVVSGLGLTGRRREAGLLRATGWRADELLVRNLAEAGVLTTAGASLAILVAHVWLGMLGGRGLVGVFVPEADRARIGDLPYRLEPEPALVGVVVAFAVVMTASIWSSWRASSAEPVEVMR